MKIERTRNAMRNIRVGMVLRVYQTVVPFLMRTAMIHFMGVEYLGLNGLFSSVLHLLSLAELGVGSAMVFSMYKPIAEDDSERICALMSLYRTYYRVIGLVIGVAGLLMTPFVPHLISGELPQGLNLYWLYWLNLGATVLSYWLFAYRNCLLVAHQRMDVVSKITLLTNAVQQVVQLLILIYVKNYYLYVIVQLFSTAMNNVLTGLVTMRRYPQYQPRGKLEKAEIRQLNRKIGDLFTVKVGTVVLNYGDTIIISMFLGLTVLAVYQNYFFILTAVITAIEMIISSITAGLGNSFITESREKNYRDMLKFSFLFTWLIGVCVCCFLGMYQPFMEIWVGRELMQGFGLVVCLAMYFYAYTLNRLLSIYKDAAGLWHQDRFNPLVTALVNLVLNLLLVKPMGLSGVLLSTVISFGAITIPWQLHNLFTLFFDRALRKEYVRLLAKNLAATALASVLVCLICAQIHASPWVELVLSMLIAVAVPNLVFLLLLHRDASFRPSIQFLDRLTKGKLKLEKRLFPSKKAAA